MAADLGQLFLQYLEVLGHQEIDPKRLPVEMGSPQEIVSVSFGDFRQA